MKCVLLPVQKLRFLWRYRNQSQSFEALKYYAILIFFNLLTVIFYLKCLDIFPTFQLYFSLVILVVLHILTNITMIRTHLTDPGYISPIRKELDLIDGIQSQILPFNGRIFLGETHSYLLNNQSRINQIKFCSVCNIYKPYLTSHCSHCKKCVKNKDHHCPWLNTCIGKNNYRVYYLHLASSVGMAMSIIWICVSILIKPQINQIIIPVIFVSVALIIAILIAIPLIILFSLHTYFVVNGISTKQYMNKKKFQNQSQSKKCNVTANKNIINKIKQLFRKDTSSSTVVINCNTNDKDKKQNRISQNYPSSSYFKGDYIQNQYQNDIFRKSLSRVTQTTTSSIPFDQ